MGSNNINKSKKGRVRISGKRPRRPEARKRNALEPVGRKLPAFFDALIRGGAIFLLVVLLIGTWTSRQVSITEAGRLEAKLAELKREREILMLDIGKFSDPEWRESYWKWRTMRHEPGEYYIDFIEPDIF